MDDYKDVEIMFKTRINKDVILKNVIVRQFKEGTITCISPDEEHKFIFNMDEISYIHVSDHGSECNIVGTHDECIYVFSNEARMPEPSKPEPIDPNCSGMRVLVKEDISDGSVELEHYTDKKEEETEND